MISERRKVFKNQHELNFSKVPDEDSGVLFVFSKRNIAFFGTKQVLVRVTQIM